MTILKDAFDWIKNHGKVDVVNHKSQTFVSRSVERLDDPTASTVQVNSLESLVRYVESEIDEQTTFVKENDGDKYLIHVESPTTVHLYGRLNDQGRRSRYVTSEALLPQYPFERFLDMEQMNIKLQSIFVKNDDRDVLLKVCGSVVEENIQTREDDGVSQVISAKTGVATIGKVAVPNPVTLAPYRTFVEVEQVESQFIFRMKEGPTAALFEADGGQWRNAAIENIKEFLADKLSENVENERILII
ncbi:hypothetical protein [Exiguobacterium sp. NG55]|uniref:hypothetical protein n=1 Tax=Exiguobacterium sp. NG55 TaxID=375477 RepID=UPI0004DFA1D5|nr:hypothetical protein [Exiguobacterium sp. NG55]